MADIEAEADASEQLSRQRNSMVSPLSLPRTTEAPTAASETQPLIQRRPREASVASSVVRRADPDDLIVYYSDFHVSVRLIRLALYFFAIISFGWFLIITINLFASVTPILESPGSGFFEIDLTLLAFAASFVTLAFFPSPTRLDLIASYLTLGLLSLDLLTLLLVPGLRHRHASNTIGLVTILGAFIIFSVNTGAQFLVLDIHRLQRENWEAEESRIDRADGSHDRGRSHQRHESKRTWGQYFALFARHSTSFLLRVIILFLFVLITIGVGGSAVSHIANEPQGELIPLDKGRYVHLFCSPRSKHAQSPVTILIEGGEREFTGDFASWALELLTPGPAQGNEKFERICYWDRPGLGYSDSAPSPQSAGSISDTLSRALARSEGGLNANDTFLLVSHGVGGLYSRVFASHRANQLHSILLVDTEQEDQYFERYNAFSGFQYLFRGFAWPLSKGRLAKVGLQQQLAKGLMRTEMHAANDLTPASTPLLVVSSSRKIQGNRAYGDAQRKLTKLTKNNVAWEILDGPHELWKDDLTKAKLQSLIVDLLDYTN